MSKNLLRDYLDHMRHNGESLRMLKIDETDSALGQSDPDQQPIQRVIGRRVSPPSGQFPSAAIRAAMDANYTRPATWQDLKSLVKYLDDANVEYALVGGYAIAAHGFSPQATAHIGSCSDNHFLAATAAEPLPAASTYYSAIALTYRDK